MPSHSVAMTYGELRKQLADCGADWQPDPSISDDEPVPAFPTGGDLQGDVPGTLLPEGGVIAFLRDTPPSNPHLREVWRRAGLLGKNPPRRG